MSTSPPGALQARLHLLVADVALTLAGAGGRPDPCDDQLIELARAGDERAWAMLVERHRASLLACARPIVGECGAQDAMQQAFISAWHALLRGHEVRSPRAWLATIARRAALEMLREQGPCCPRQLAPRDGEEHSADEHHELLARARAALAAVAALPAHERDALVWTSLHGRSAKDSARALGVSEGALRQLVFRARERTRAAIGGLLPPALVPRLAALSTHGARRLGGDAQAQLSAPLAAQAGDGLGWLAPALAAAVLAAAPIAALQLAPAGRRQAQARHALTAPRIASALQLRRSSARRQLTRALIRGPAATPRRIPDRHLPAGNRVQAAATPAAAGAGAAGWGGSHGAGSAGSGQASQNAREGAAAASAIAGNLPTGAGEPSALPAPAPAMSAAPILPAPPPGTDQIARASAGAAGAAPATAGTAQEQVSGAVDTTVPSISTPAGHLP